MRRAVLPLLVLLLATPGAPTPQATAPDPAAERARDLVERVLAALAEGARAALLEAAGLDARVLGSSFLEKARALLDAGDTDAADLSFGYALRLFNPEAYLGNSFKLKPADAGFFNGWHGLGEPTIASKLEPLE